jgi:plastocyanin
MRKISGLIGALTLIFAVTSCGGGSTAPGGGGGGGGGGGNNCSAVTFCMSSTTFFTAAASTQPVTLTVNTNTAVTWFNDGIAHNVVFDNPASALAVVGGNSGDILDPATGSNQRQFAAAGTYPFHCTIHGTKTTGMRGAVIVQ